MRIRLTGLAEFSDNRADLTPTPELSWGWECREKDPGPAAYEFGLMRLVCECQDGHTGAHFAWPQTGTLVKFLVGWR